jgi:DNA-binding NarL/FixJ family response regulator
MMSTRVFLVDDEPAVRKGLSLLLGREEDMEICGEAGSATDALKQMLTLKPDLAIIDLSLDKENGLDLIKDLSSFGTKPRILVFSMHSESSYIRAAFGAGADGYVMKEEGTERLLDAVHTLVRGKQFLTEALAAKLGSRSEELRPDPPRIPGRD